ncbi:MAG TPA: serine acetyltransferase [Accumulibacter sp.]|uniref:serine O-acetyltransferase n=1 Tax=Accumulibacter sp. TaxID=2053492 RepID=UPI002CEC5C86|nr:serine acetyltransferase [Accumulibacter sp.]HRD87463.1 serine acetyltransferase [Accumulibacter sp.]
MVLSIHRVAHTLWKWHIPLIPKLLKIVNRVVFGVVLPPSVLIGKNALLSYQGLGTVVHKSAQIGNSVIISTGVTIGGRSGKNGAPIICDGALIGTGAKVLGPIRVGVSASIGANAVVIEDVPDYAVVVGVPARIVRINKPEDVPRYDIFD